MAAQDEKLTELSGGDLSDHASTSLGVQSSESAPAGAAGVFAGKGMWIWEGARTSAEQLCSELRGAGYEWITVKAQDGAGPTSDNTPETIDAYRAAAANHQLRFTIWGYLYAIHPPEEEAANALRLIADYHAAGYIADAEAEYEAATSPVSKRFCRAFRAKRAHFPAAISSFGRIDQHPGLDWGAWKHAGFVFMPQAYACDNARLDPRDCVSQAERFWPRSRQYPTLGTYAGVVTHLTGRQLAASVKGLLVPGINLWDAQECSREQLAADYGY